MVLLGFVGLCRAALPITEGSMFDGGQRPMVNGFRTQAF